MAKPDGGGAGGARAEPAIDCREIRGLPEDDLPARWVCRDRCVDGARRPRGDERAFDLPELRRQAAAVRLGDELGQHRGSSRRFELVLGLVLSRHEHFEHERLALAAAPGLQRLELGPLFGKRLRLVVPPIAGEHLDERAGERGGKGVGRPRQRNRAGLLRGSSNRESRLQCIGDHGRRILLVDEQRAELARGGGSLPRANEAVVGDALHVADPLPRQRTRVAEFLPLPAMIGGEHVNTMGVKAMSAY